MVNHFWLQKFFCLVAEDRVIAEEWGFVFKDIADRDCKHSVFLSPQYLFYMIDWCIVVRKAQVLRPWFIFHCYK